MTSVLLILQSLHPVIIAQGLICPKIPNANDSQATVTVHNLRKLSDFTIGASIKLLETVQC